MACDVVRLSPSAEVSPPDTVAVLVLRVDAPSDVAGVPETAPARVANAGQPSVGTQGVAGNEAEVAGLLRVGCPFAGALCHGVAANEVAVPAVPVVGVP